MARITYFTWIETKIDAQRVVTAGEDGKKVETLTPQEHIRRALEIPEAIQAGDARPTLVYFHWPHDGTANGKLSDTLCDRALVDEMTARWGLLFRGVQLDMAKSDPKFLALLEVGDKPSFVIVDVDAKVIAHIPPLISSAKLQKALEDAAGKIPDVAARVKDALAAQAKAMAEAKALLKADKLDEALLKINEVRFSDVRVGPLFDKAQQDGLDIQARITREAEKAGKK